MGVSGVCVPGEGRVDAQGLLHWVWNRERRGFHSEEGGHPLERFDWRHAMIFVFFKDGDKIHLT